MVFKLFKSENIYKIRAKVLCNGYKTTFMEKCIKFTINIGENLPIIFPTIRSTKHFVDRVLADYNGYYICKNPVSWKNMVFSGTCLIDSR